MIASEGLCALLLVLGVVLVVTLVAVAFVGLMEAHEEAAMRTRCAREAEAAIAARRKGGCAVRWR